MCVFVAPDLTFCMRMLHIKFKKLLAFREGKSHLRSPEVNLVNVVLKKNNFEGPL